MAEWNLLVEEVGSKQEGHHFAKKYTQTNNSGLTRFKHGHPYRSRHTQIHTQSAHCDLSPFVTEPRLTYSQLLTEDCPLPQRRTVPASVSELVLTLVDAHLGAFTHNNDGVRAALADGPLAWCQPGDLVADDVGTQSHHRRQGPAKKARENTTPHVHVSVRTQHISTGTNTRAHCDTRACIVAHTHKHRLS